MELLRSIFESFRSNPMKSAVTMLTVALGAAVLMLALSVSSLFQDLTAVTSDEHGIIMAIGNVEADSDGLYESVRPPEFNADIADLLRSEIPEITLISPTLRPPGGRYLINGQEYQIRSAAGASADYFDIFQLEPAAGVFFTASEVDQSTPVAVLSESAAIQAFGSAEAALGQKITSPANFLMGPGQNRARISMPVYEIIGVYRDLPEIERKAYSVGDLIVPLYSAMPSGLPRNMVESMANSILYTRVEGLSAEQLEATVREIVSREYDDDISVEVWEGTPRGDSSVLQQVRDTTATFTFIINLLGFVLLVSGSIGIFSIMMVDVLGRVREMSLERALGASRRRILGEFVFRSGAFAVVSGLIGVIFAAAASAPLRDLVLPLFTDIAPQEIPRFILSAGPAAIALVSTTVLGALFGIFPVMSQLQLPIADGLREA